MFDLSSRHFSKQVLLITSGFVVSPLSFAVSSELSQHYYQKNELSNTADIASIHPNHELCSGVWLSPTTKQTLSDTQNTSLTNQQNQGKLAKASLTSQTNGANNSNNETTQHSAKNSPSSEREATDKTIYAYADALYYSPNVKGELVGNVTFTQGEQTIRADKMQLDLQTKQAKAQGNISATNEGLFTQSDSLDIDLTTNKAKIKDSEFFTQNNQAHGSAKEISRPRKGVTILKEVAYSTCPPNQAQIITQQQKQQQKSNTNNKNQQHKGKAWSLSAKQLFIDEKSGRGEAVDTRLYIAGYPIVSLPYLNFPIDGRRQSGFLVPQLGLSSKSGVDLTLPYYFNLATNYDMTITPRYLSKRGAMIEGELRFLSNYGKTVADFGYLPNDAEENDKDRKKLSVEHLWQISPVLSLHGFYHYVSDKNYLTDLSRDLRISDTLNIPRGLTLSYDNPEKNFNSKVSVETFQTVDGTVSDKTKPYARLPQISAHYSTNDTKDSSLTDEKGQWYAEAAMDAGYFVKPIKDQSAIEDSGIRYFNTLTAGYRYEQAWGKLQPQVSLKHITSWFDQNSSEQRELAEENRVTSVSQPELSLSGQLNFEKKTKLGNKQYLQTISPKFYYVYAPYRDQSELPNYDTVSSSLSYDQLFTNERFIGSDRLADNNALTLGVDYKLYDSSGLERLKLGVASRTRFERYQTNLAGNKAKVAKNSGAILRAQGYITPKIKFMSDFAITGEGAENFNISSLTWQPHADTLINLGYFQRAELDESQNALKQTLASFMLPLSNKWQLFGLSQYDLRANKHRDLLFGANYESCCYSFALYGRNYYNTLDSLDNTGKSSLSDDKPTQLIMASVTLKGLAGFSNNLANLLSEKVLGYDDVYIPSSQLMRK